MTVRILASGDEPAAENACRRFGLHGAIGASAILASEDAVLVIAEHEGVIVGWTYGHELIHPDGERTMLLYALDVAEPWRRQGHGTALVTAFIQGWPTRTHAPGQVHVEAH